MTLLTLHYNRNLWNKNTKPARDFHKELLPRLKFHNPALPIKVETANDGRLELTFESADQTTLAKLDSSRSPDELKDLAFKEAWSKVQSKPVPDVNAGSPSSASPAQPTFTRQVTLELGQQHSEQIWRWFQSTTNCEDFPEDPIDSARMEELRIFFEKAEEDRQRVKAGMDAMRKQKADLKKAREAAERLANEA